MRNATARATRRPRRLGAVRVAAAIVASPAAAEAETERAFDFGATYTADLWRNVSGGRAVGSRVLDNLDLTLAVDGERAFGWSGVDAYVYVLYNNGQAMSDPLVGEFQTVSNIETGVRAVRLYEAWVQKRFAGDRASVKLGLYDLNSEFDAIGTAGLFLNASHGIGPDFSQSGRNGPSIFPVTSLAARGEFTWEPLTFRAAVLDGVPGDPAHPARTAVKLGRGDGALLVAEAQAKGAGWTATLGGWRYTSRLDTFDTAATSGTVVQRRGNSGAYASLEAKLASESADPDQGLSGWLRVGHADPEFNPVKTSLGGGLVYTGPVPGRDRDQLGLAFAAASFGRQSAEARGAPGSGAGDVEINIELSYRAPINSWLTVQPDIQHVIRPGGDGRLPNATLVGMRIEASY